VSDIKGGTQTEGFLEQGAEENIWTEEGRRMKRAGGWIKLHNEELHNLYCSSSIIRIIKSRRVR
jgi:hypothetical protein